MRLQFLYSCLLATAACPAVAETAVNAAVTAAPVVTPVITWGYGIKVLLTLLLVLAVIVGLLFGLRRLQDVATTKQGQMKLLGALPVGPKEKVVLVSVAGQKLVLGVASHSVTLLSTLEGDESLGDAMESQKHSEPGTQTSTPFNQQLKTLLSRQ